MTAPRTLEHFPNLVTMFFTRADEKGDAPFLWAKRDGAWQATSWLPNGPSTVEVIATMSPLASAATKLVVEGTSPEGAAVRACASRGVPAV
jgi:long-chain acyl-CoA synthetase